MKMFADLTPPMKKLQEGILQNDVNVIGTVKYKLQENNKRWPRYHNNPNG